MEIEHRGAYQGASGRWRAGQQSVGAAPAPGSRSAALTLIQTGKIKNLPVVLVGTEHWAGLVEWLRAQLLQRGRVDERDLILLHVTDDPQEVVHIVRRCHALQLAALGLEP